MSTLCCSPTHSDPRSCACWLVVTESPFSPVIRLYCAETGPVSPISPFSPIPVSVSVLLRLPFHQVNHGLFIAAWIEGADEPEGESRRRSRLGLRKTFMRPALVTSPARAPSMVLYSMALSAGPRSFPIAASARGESAQSTREGCKPGRGRMSPPLPVPHMLKTPSTNPTKADHQVSDLLIHWIYTNPYHPGYLELVLDSKRLDRDTRDNLERSSAAAKVRFLSFLRLPLFI